MTPKEDPYDFFVSYARADNQSGWINAFIEELITDQRRISDGRELIPFFDRQAINGFDDWCQRIYSGLAASRLFLAFLSPNYLASEWCRREWDAWLDIEIATHILSEGAAPIYIIEVPGLATSMSEEEVAHGIAKLCGLPAPHLNFICNAAPVVRQLRRRQFNFVEPFFKEGLNALHRDDFRRVLERLVRNLDERVEFVRVAAQSEIYRFPPFNRRFSGRLDELYLLRQRLNDDRAGVICGVHGLGGIGKTELAFTYAHAYGGVYPGGRFYIPCEGRSTLRDAVLTLGDFTDFRARITDEQRMVPDSYFSALCECLSTRLKDKGRILMVLDNVTDLNMLSVAETDTLTCLGPNLHLLATTRLLPPAGSGTKWLTLGELPESDAMILLEKHRPFLDPVTRRTSDAESRAARSIVRQLGGFTLAIELVGAWMLAHPTFSYASIADNLGLQELEDLAGDESTELRRHNHEKRLSAVLRPILQALSPAERRTMEYASLLPPNVVPQLWLKELVTHDFPELSESKPRSDPWANLWQHLLNFALITHAEDKNSTHEGRNSTAPLIYRVHRLVQDFFWSAIPDIERAAHYLVVNEYIHERTTILGKTTSWQTIRWEVEALDALSQLWNEANYTGAADLLFQVGEFWRIGAQWSRAEFSIRCALANWEQIFGKDHLKFAIANNSLALLLQATNRLTEAENLFRRSIATLKKQLKPDDPQLAMIYNNLGILLGDTNRMAEAEPLLRCALKIVKKKFGAGNPDVKRIKNNLAYVLWTINRLNEAELLYENPINEINLQEADPLVAIRLNNQAQLFQRMHRMVEAEELNRCALAILEKCYGPDHPDVGIALNVLGELFRANKRMDEAEPLFRRALAIFEKNYGPEHPDVSCVLNNLSLLLMDTDRNVEAEQLIRRAVIIDEKTFGDNHPLFATKINNLAKLLTSTDRVEEAELLYNRSLLIFERHGRNHLDVAMVLNNIVQLLQKTGRFEEVESLYRRIIVIREISLGKNHPDVAESLLGLASFFYDRQLRREADLLMLRVLVIWEKCGEALSDDEKQARDTLRLRFQKKMPKSFRRVTQKIGPNAPCPCGSGKKYKKCCGRLDR